jgi:hypothetical protein
MAEMSGYDGKSVEGWRRGFADQSRAPSPYHFLKESA